MSIIWNWNEKVGYVVVEEYGKTYELSLYEGNAYLIFLDEHEEDGKRMYAPWSYWVDKQHAMNCLGLSKQFHENIYITDGKSKILEIGLSSNYRYRSQVISMLAKAFVDTGITIRLIPKGKE